MMWSSMDSRAPPFAVCETCENLRLKALYVSFGCDIAQPSLQRTNLCVGSAFGRDSMDFESHDLAFHQMASQQQPPPRPPQQLSSPQDPLPLRPHAQLQAHMNAGPTVSSSSEK